MELRVVEFNFTTSWGFTFPVRVELMPKSGSYVVDEIYTFAPHGAEISNELLEEIGDEAILLAHSEDGDRAEWKKDMFSDSLVLVKRFDL